MTLRDNQRLIYPECRECIALPFCNKVKGKVPINTEQKWCNARYRLLKAIDLAQIPKAYLKANIYNYKVDSDNKETFNRVSPFIENIIKEVDGGLNVFLYSNGSGNGKTYTASLFLNHYIYKTCNTPLFDFENPLGMFVEYTRYIHHARYKDDYEDVFKEFEAMQQTPLLLLDDICSGKMSDFAREQTYLLLNSRYNKGLSTVITSNISLKILMDDELLGRRSVSRISNNLLNIEIKGKDRRVELR